MSDPLANAIDEVATGNRRGWVFGVASFLAALLLGAFFIQIVETAAVYGSQTRFVTDAGVAELPLGPSSSLVWAVVALLALLAGRMGWHVGRRDAALREEVEHRRNLQLELRQTTQQLREARNSLERHLAQDGLTGVVNRQHFDGALERELRRSARTGKPLSLTLCSIDGMSAYNGARGNMAGDLYLKQAARAIESCCRRPTDLVGRFHGDVFCVLLGETEAAGAANIGETIRATVERVAAKTLENGQPELLTVTVAVATLQPDQASTVEQLLVEAVRVLHVAKGEGANSVHAASVDAEDLLQASGAQA